MSTQASRSLVSVVLPLHDTPPAFLREAIESVRAQVEVDWELVVVMDATTASCASAAHEMATLDPARIRVLGELGGQPRGASAARNPGIAHSRGGLLGFLDADDVYEPDVTAGNPRATIVADLSDAAHIPDASFDTLEHCGNVLSASAMLYGLSADDLAPDELDESDPDYPVIIGARARRTDR